MVSKRLSPTRFRTFPLASRPVFKLYLTVNLIRRHQASPTSTVTFSTPKMKHAQSTRALMLRVVLAVRRDRRLVLSKRQTSSVSRSLIKPNRVNLLSTRARSECLTMQLLRALYGITQGPGPTRCGQTLSAVSLSMLKALITSSKDYSLIKALRTSKMCTTHEKRAGSSSTISPSHWERLSVKASF